MKRPVPRPRAAGPLIPGWAIMLAIPVTAVVTVWALKGRPGFGAAEAPDIPMQVRRQPPPVAQPPASMQPPAVAQPPVSIQPPVVSQPPVAAQPVAPAAPIEQVAAIGPRAPIIIAGSRRPHLDRGPCTTCHEVVRPNGARMPTIRSDSIMPHPYPGGMCINCHTTVPPLKSLTGVALPGAMQPNGNNNPDAKWKGMEVGPITGIAAMQFGTPAGINGAVVTEVEGAAQAAGVRMGDVVMAVDGAPVTDVMSFNAATANGQLPSGTVQVLRDGTLMEVPIGVRPGASAMFDPPVAVPPGMAAASPQAPGCAPGTQPVPGAAEDNGMRMQVPPQGGGAAPF